MFCGNAEGELLLPYCVYKSTSVILVHGCEVLLLGLNLSELNLVGLMKGPSNASSVTFYSPELRNKKVLMP